MPTSDISGEDCAEGQRLPQEHSWTVSAGTGTRMKQASGLDLTFLQICGWLQIKMSCLDTGQFRIVP